MKRVFIAYSHQNQAFAARLAQDLSDAGLQVWADLGMEQAGDIRRDAIRLGLESVDFLIACLSLAAITSEQVQYAIATVRDRGGAIYPIMVEASLAALQSSKALGWLADMPVIHFDNRYEQAFAELLETLSGKRIPASLDDITTSAIPNPFKGLQAFQQMDSTLFFGREDVTRLAINRLRETHFLAVVGASGSGKSSLVRAGIIPQIRQGALEGSDTWVVLMLTPGAHPIDELARRLSILFTSNPRKVSDVKAELRQSGQVLSLIDAVLHDKPHEARLLLVIDQFEEVFTHTGETERVQFLDIVRVLSVLNTSRAHVILTMRADYFGQLSHYPDLAQLFEQANLLILTEMTAANLVGAIENPAQAVGLRYEAGLVDRLLNVVQAQSGSLPRLQYTLHELFQRRSDTKLTLAAYDAIGGVQHALAHHADALFNELDRTQQDILRRVLLCLVDVSEAGEVAVRQVARDELVLPDVADSAVQLIIDRLAHADSRLITVQRTLGKIDAPVILQISHEAFINAWDKFQAWVAASLDDLQYEAEFRRSADNWESNDHDEAYLLCDERLVRAEKWSQTHHATTLQQIYLAASIALRRDEQLQAGLARELQLRQRGTRKTRWLVGLMIILLISVLFGLLLWLSGDFRVG